MSNLNLFRGIQYDTANYGKLKTGVLVGASDTGEEAAGSTPLFQDSIGASVNYINRLVKLNLYLRKHIVSTNPIEQLVAINGVQVKLQA